MGILNQWDKDLDIDIAIKHAIKSSVQNLFTQSEFLKQIIIEQSDSTLQPYKVIKPSPIKMGIENSTQPLYVSFDPLAWMDLKSSNDKVGHFYLGEGCYTKKEMLAKTAKEFKASLFPSSHSAGKKVIATGEAYNYEMWPITDDTVAQIKRTGGYTLHAEIVDFTYDACAPRVKPEMIYSADDSFISYRIKGKQIKFVIQWTLKTDQNRTILFQTKTIGYAGSLLANSKPYEHLINAIEFATKKLLSDKEFVSKITRKQDLNANQLLKTKLGISNSNQNYKDKIQIISESSPWKDLDTNKKIGSYAYGNKCTLFKIKVMPEAFNDFPNLFPSGHSNALSVANSLRNLGYKYSILSSEKASSASSNYNRHRLFTKIIDLKYDSCGPQLNEEWITEKHQVIHHYHYKRNKIEVTIKWGLMAKGKKEPVYSQTTIGMSDNWLINTNAGSTMGKAIEDATNQLFADPAFILTLQKKDKVEPSGFFDKLTSFLHSTDTIEKKQLTAPILTRYQLNAKFAGALTYIQQIKLKIKLHYETTGEWPKSFRQLKINKNLILESDMIDDIYLKPNGMMFLELGRVFGKNKIIKFSPMLSKFDRLEIKNWACESNVAQKLMMMKCNAL